MHDDQRRHQLRNGLIVAARRAQHGNAGLGAGGNVKIRGSCAAVADEPEALVAVKNLFGHAVKLGNEDVGLNLEEIFKHLVLIVALAGFGPRLVDDLVEHGFQLIKIFFGIRGAYINFHSCNLTF